MFLKITSPRGQHGPVAVQELQSDKDPNFGSVIADYFAIRRTVPLLRKGQRKIVEKDYEGAHHYLTRSRDIVNELLVTLRVEEGNKVAQNLRSLYVFMIGRIIEANLKKDAAIVDEVLKVAQNLRDGWTQLKDQQAQLRQQKHQTSANDEIVRQRKIRLHG